MTDANNVDQGGNRDKGSNGNKPEPTTVEQGAGATSQGASGTGGDDSTTSSLGDEAIDALRRAGLDDGAIDALRNAKERIDNARANDGLPPEPERWAETRAKERKRQRLDEQEKAARRAEAEDPGNRPTIQLRKSQIASITSEVQELLAGTGLYQRGGKIVRPGFVKAIDRDGREVLVPGIITLDAHQLRRHISQYIHFVEKKVRSKKLIDIPVDYSLEYTNALLSLGDGLDTRAFPLLKAVIVAPVVLDSGRIIQTPGYDAASKLYYDPLGVEFPKIPENPTKDDAREALKKLKVPLAKYPFKIRDPSRESENSNAALSVALSLYLTLVNRVAWPMVPGHAIVGNTPGVGKGMLVASASIIAIGKSAALVDQGNKDDEFEKKLATRMLKGIGHIPIDDAERTIKSSMLDMAMTADTIAIRVLGKSEDVEVPNIYTITVTGNQLEFSGDAYRRWLQCDIETPSERPDLLEFDFSPTEYAQKNRVELVVAALTVIKAYITAERPNAVKLGSFEQWSMTVRSALIWLGEPDPCGTIEIIRSTDPVLSLRNRLLELWETHIGSDSMTIPELRKEVQLDKDRPSWEHPMRDVFLDIAGKDLDGRRWSWFFRKMKAKPINGRTLVTTERRKGDDVWRLETKDEEEIPF
jgi:hypothetical protein